MVRKILILPVFLSVVFLVSFLANNEDKNRINLIDELVQTRIQFLFIQMRYLLMQEKAPDSSRIETYILENGTWKGLSNSDVLASSFVSSLEKGQNIGFLSERDQLSGIFTVGEMVNEKKLVLTKISFSYLSNMILFSGWFSTLNPGDVLIGFSDSSYQWQWFSSPWSFSLPFFEILKKNKRGDGEVSLGADSYILYSRPVRGLNWQLHYFLKVTKNRNQEILFFSTVLLALFIWLFFFRKTVAQTKKQPQGVQNPLPSENIDFSVLLDKLPVFAFLVSKDDVVLYETKFSQIVRKTNGLSLLDLISSVQDEILSSFSLSHPLYRQIEIKGLYREDHLGFSVVIQTVLSKGTEVCLVIYSETENLALQPSFSQEISHLRFQNEALRVDLEKARQAEQFKGNFLATMSHEIRTCMNGITGVVDLLLKTKVNLEQRKQLNVIKFSSGLLLGLINDILDHAKIEAGRLEIEKQEFDSESMLRSLVSPFSSRSQDKGVEFTLDLHPDLSSVWYGDQRRISQVLMNLLSNSVKFTEHGEIWLKISLAQNPSDLLFEIGDTGIGMSSLQLTGLFERFTQADRNISKIYGGTGLGMSISKQLVDLMGGEIDVSSTPGKGTVFKILLPGLMTRSGSIVQKFFKETGTEKSVLILGECTKRGRSLSRIFESVKIRSLPVDRLSVARQFLDSSLGSSGFDYILVDVCPGFGEIRPFLEEYLQKTRARFLLLVDDKEHERLSMTIQERVSLLRKPGFISEIFCAISGQEIIESREASLVDLSSETLLPMKILVVDDESVNHFVVEEILKKSGHEVLGVKSALNAFEVLEKKSFDLIFMDMFMPELGGIEATSRIRAKEKLQGRSTIIIAMTASVLEEDRQSCLKAGMNDVLHKPVTEESLFAILRKFSRVKTGEKEAFKARVLVVEDNLLNQRLIKKLLTNKNYFVEVAANGQIGVDIFFKKKFDLIIMDLMMPVMSGFEAAEKIREKSEVPIVALTADRSPGVEERCVQSGMNRYLSKPVNPQQLLSVIEEIISGIRSSSSENEHDFSKNVSGTGEFSKTGMSLSEKTMSHEKKQGGEEDSESLSINFLSQLRKRYSDDSILLRLFEDAKSEIPLKISEIEELLSQKNFSEAANRMHALKGQISYVDSGALTDLVQVMEQELKNSILQHQRLTQTVHATAPESELSGPMSDGSGLQGTGKPLAEWYILSSSFEDFKLLYARHEKKMVHWIAELRHSIKDFVGSPGSRDDHNETKNG